MADVADTTRLVALEAKKKLIGDFLRRRQEFQGIRSMESNIQKLSRSLENLEKGIKAGNAKDVEKAEKRLAEYFDDALKNMEAVMLDLIYDAHIIKESLIRMEMDEKELKKLKAPERMTRPLEIKHAESLKKINDILKKVGSLAMGLETSEQ